MISSAPEVVAIGCIAADLAVVGAKAGIGAGGTELVESIQALLGGNPSNMASGLARLGHRVIVAGRLGDDLFGRFIVDRLNTCGVDTHLLRLEKGAATPTTIAMIQPCGERNLFHCQGSNGTLTEEDFHPAAQVPAKVFFAGGMELLPGLRGGPASRLLKAARVAGMRTVLDTTFDPKGEWLAAIAEALPFVDVLLPSMGEAAHYAGSRSPREIFEFFRKHGAGRVILKDGAAGCYLEDEGSLWQVRPPRVNVVDTTGAGDNFAAGFIAGILRHFSWLDAARLGVTCGALSTEGLGGEAPYREFSAVWEMAKGLPVQRI